MSIFWNVSIIISTCFEQRVVLTEGLHVESLWYLEKFDWLNDGSSFSSSLCKCRKRFLGVKVDKKGVKWREIISAHHRITCHYCEYTVMHQPRLPLSLDTTRGMALVGFYLKKMIFFFHFQNISLRSSHGRKI